MEAQPAGWYPDPRDPSIQRYWDGAAWTGQQSPRQPSTPTTPGPSDGIWYFVITWLGCGLLSSVPFFHAASHLNRPRLNQVGLCFVAATVAAAALIWVAPEDDAGTPTGPIAGVGTAIMLAVLLVATGLQIGLRREVYGPGSTPRPRSGNESAQERVQEGRRKRQEARELAARDPMMARELRIGRPIPGSAENYDDGGLIELNYASAEQLTTVCGLPPEMATAVVDARTRLERFQIVEDAITFGQVTEDFAPMIRDRGIVIADL